MSAGVLRMSDEKSKPSQDEIQINLSSKDLGDLVYMAHVDAACSVLIEDSSISSLEDFGEALETFQVGFDEFKSWARAISDEDERETLEKFAGRIGWELDELLDLEWNDYFMEGDLWDDDEPPAVFWMALEEHFMNGSFGGIFKESPESQEKDDATEEPKDEASN